MISITGLIISVIISYTGGFLMGKRIKIETVKHCTNCGSLKSSKKE